MDAGDPLSPPARPVEVAAGEVIWLVAGSGREEATGGDEAAKALGTVLAGDTDRLFVEGSGGVPVEGCLDRGAATVEVGAEGYALHFDATVSVVREEIAAELVEVLGTTSSGDPEILEVRRCSDLLWLQRRQWVRVPVSIDGVMKGGRLGTSFGCRVVNLSGGGAMVVAGSRLEQGSLAGLRMDLHGDVQQLLTRVVSCDDAPSDGGHGVRLAFRDLTEAQRRKICGYVLRMQLLLSRSSE